jgi:hypothetical protein
MDGYGLFRKVFFACLPHWECMYECKTRYEDRGAPCVVYINSICLIAIDTHIDTTTMYTSSRVIHVFDVTLHVKAALVSPTRNHRCYPSYVLRLRSAYPCPVLAFNTIQDDNSKHCLTLHTWEIEKMAAPKLPFLWPMLFKPSKPTRIRVRARAPLSNLSTRRNLATTSFRCIEAPIQRYGTAHEPAPHLREDIEKKDPTPPQLPHSPAKDVEEEEDDYEPHIPTETPSTPSKASAIEDTPPPYTPPNPPKTGEAKPLDSVLHMPSPAEEDLRKPPHLKTPPYVHHFDTYGLVRQLSKSTYTEAQSVTLMKAVRSILIENMMLARQGLVSKSNVENETYLFQAACAELKTEIGNVRKGEIERMRTERNQLQHEVDILGQKLGQETGSVKDELKGLFDDRKMAVRQEQRSMETKVCCSSLHNSSLLFFFLGRLKCSVRSVQILT